MKTVTQFLYNLKLHTKISHFIAMWIIFHSFSPLAIPPSCKCFRIQMPNLDHAKGVFVNIEGHLCFCGVLRTAKALRVSSLICFIPWMLRALPLPLLSDGGLYATRRSPDGARVSGWCHQSIARRLLSRVRCELYFVI